MRSPPMVGLVYTAVRRCRKLCERQA